MINDYADIPLQTIEKKGSTLLFSLLENRDEETFSQLCAENCDRLDELHEKHQSTYLQLACQKGLPKAVQALLQNGVDPNENYHLNLYSPIMMAGLKGYYDIVEMLAQHNEVCHKSTKRGTVLHSVLEGMSRARKRFDSSFVVEKCVNCMNVLLKKRPGIPNSLDVNARNEDDLTALHLAVKLKEKRIILLLLKHGAYIGAKCSRGYTAISFIKANVLEECLNNCIRTEGELPNYSTNYKIIYDYSFLTPPRIGRYKPEVSQGDHALVSETKPLIKMSDVPELRHLLKHPVLTSFLYMKWFTVRKYFWINFTFYVTFWFCLTVHTIALKGFKQANLETLACTKYPSIILCGFLGLREFFKFCISPTLYVSNWENLLDIALLTSNLFVLFCRDVKAEVAAIAVLLTWTEMVLLINRHPLLSLNIEIYKKVCFSFVKLLAWWSMLIAAVALCFFLLFNDDANTDGMRKSNDTASYNCTKEEKNDITLFFLTILQVIGQSETSKLSFPCRPVISLIYSLFFQFLVPIFVFNLMSGVMASNDTEAIRNDAKIVGHVSLANQIVSIEKDCLKTFRFCNMTLNLIMKGRLSTVRKMISVVFNEQVNLFPHVPPPPTAYVFPNQSTQIWTQKSFNGWIDSEIMNETAKILQERKSKREENERSPNSYSEELKKYSDELKRHSEELHKEYARRLALLEETTNEKLNKVIELLGHGN